MYRCMVDEEFLKFKESIHDIIYKVSHDEEVNEVDRELFLLHLEDLYDNFREAANCS